jgi:hypothetical protein
LTTIATTSPATSILAESEDNNGGTFTCVDGKPVTTGIAATAEVLATVQTLTLDAIDAARDSIMGGEALGTWYDEDNGCWEISRTWVWPQALRETAFETAREWGERYVYDLDADECLPVP